MPTRGRPQCAICQKTFRSSADAAACEAQGAPAPRFRPGQAVYPRYIGSGPTGGATILGVRIAKGSHAVEYEIIDPNRHGTKPRRWIQESYTFPTPAERIAAQEQDRRGVRRAAAARVPTTPTMRASYRRILAQNRATAEAHLAAGEPVFTYQCRSRNHGRPPTFYTGREDAQTQCPACGAPGALLIAVPVPAVIARQATPAAPAGLTAAPAPAPTRVRAPRRRTAPATGAAAAH